MLSGPEGESWVCDGVMPRPSRCCVLRAPRATSVDVPDGNQSCVLPHQSTKSARCLLREDSAEIKKRKEVKVVPNLFFFDRCGRRCSRPHFSWWQLFLWVRLTFPLPFASLAFRNHLQSQVPIPDTWVDCATRVSNSSTPGLDLSAKWLFVAVSAENIYITNVSSISIMFWNYLSG